MFPSNQESNRRNSEEIMFRRLLKMGVIGAVILIALITLFSSMRSVDAGRVGVVTQYRTIT